MQEVNLRVIMTHCFVDHVLKDADDAAVSVTSTENAKSPTTPSEAEGILVATENASEQKSETNVVSEIVDFKVVWNKNTFPVTFDLGKKVEDLKELIKELTGKKSFMCCGRL